MHQPSLTPRHNMHRILLSVACRGACVHTRQRHFNSHSALTPLYSVTVLGFFFAVSSRRHLDGIARHSHAAELLTAQRRDLRR
mmetsp:Transcript_58915/g.131316  ORF Transcript_58915/g.131316 Transcript_58915/m.131316 type:complete len:83 (+) Transcript_58915:229-477(+)